MYERENLVRTVMLSQVVDIVPCLPPNIERFRFIVFGVRVVGAFPHVFAEESIMFYVGMAFITISFVGFYFWERFCVCRPSGIRLMLTGTLDRHGVAKGNKSQALNFRQSSSRHVQDVLYKGFCAVVRRVWRNRISNDTRARGLILTRSVSRARSRPSTTAVGRQKKGKENGRSCFVESHHAARKPIRIEPRAGDS